MRNVQEIFYAVIDANLYRMREQDFHSKIVAALRKVEDWRNVLDYDEFMCNSLFIAVRKNVITADEHAAAQREINEYLNGWGTLVSALDCSDLAHEFPDQLEIYRSWGNRPNIISKMKWDAALFDL